jgi:GH15 family glucan-1,4-alpha-glucosidase
MATTSPASGRRPVRDGGALPLRDYALIGNKRTAALVALDGSIDWMPIPTLGGPSVFAAVLDDADGGRFELRPTAPFRAERRYVDGTNVLETTFSTADGAVRITDALSRPIARGLLWNQVIRRIDGLGGTVELEWRIAPRFDYAATLVAPEGWSGVPVFVHGQDVLAVEAFDAGRPQLAGDAVHGRFAAGEGSTAVIALSAFHDEPLTFSTRDHLLERLDATIARWREWVRSCRYQGPWQEAVRRSALALDLLVDDETGAIAAAATMGLPEKVGGARNFDYRYGWLSVIVGRGR